MSRRGDKVRRMLKLGILGIFISLEGGAIIINVPGDQPTIQSGIDSAMTGDTVLVQPGVYFENINFNGKSIIVSSLYLTADDTSYISQTIIDGSNNGSVVVFENGEDSLTIFSGFSLTNGYAYRGGGVYCVNSSPKLMYLHINGNVTDHYDWINGKEGEGGGIYCKNSKSYINKVIIKSNESWGGKWSLSTAGVGGGIYLTETSNVIIENSVIKKNRAGDGAGIFCNNYSNPILNNVTISGNLGWGAYQAGGAMFCGNNSNPVLFNVTMVSNKVTDPYGSYAGGIFCYNSSNPVLVNSILWNNHPFEIWFSNNDLPNSIVISNSNICDSLNRIALRNNGILYWLNGNIDEYPVFVDTVFGNYNLQFNSTCIDAGIQDTFIVYNNNQDTIIIPPMDYKGSSPDMGAYEFDPATNIVTQPEIARQFKLYQNFPNQFNPVTTISYRLPKSSFVNLSIYNVLGEKVVDLLNNEIQPGKHVVQWDAGKFSSGVYVYKLTVDNHSAVGKCILLK